MDRAQSKWSIPRRLSFNLLLIKIGQAGLEAAFQVPMPGDSGSSPNAGSISNYCLTQEIFTPTPVDCCPSISLKQCFGQYQKYILDSYASRWP